MKRIAQLLVLVSIGACAVDETGYLIIEDAIRYSSATTLSDLDQEVVVVGLPGSLPSGEGTVTVTNARTGGSAQALISDTSFIATLAARADDTLSVTSGESEVVLVLTDHLDTVDVPERCGMCLGDLYMSTGDDTVILQLALLMDRTLPILVYNETRGASVVVTDATSVPPVAGSSGDTMCIFRLTTTQDAASETYCEPLP